jgi:hypothetical protein
MTVSFVVVMKKYFKVSKSFSPKVFAPFWMNGQTRTFFKSHNTTQLNWVEFETMDRPHTHFHIMLSFNKEAQKGK